MTIGIPQPHVLREYALLADGERGALIGPRGDIAWLCAPRWHDDALFASLIGGRSMFAITPRGRFVWGGHYEDGSLIWRSRWVTTDGIVECREALTFPGDARRAILVRRLLAVRGDAHADLTFALPADHGGDPTGRLALDDHGRWHARAGALHVCLDGVPRARTEDHDATLRAELHVAEGGHLDIVLDVSTGAGGDPLLHPDVLWQRTENAWRAAVPAFSDSIAVRDARHSYAVLRGLTSAGGGMVAAATTSLPERAEQGRNYDYRYVWIRDQCYAGQAVALDGPHPLLDDAVAFVTERLLDDGPELKPAYTVEGKAVPDQLRLALPGYPGGTDLVGNHANRQFQLDAFGEALLLYAAAARHDRLTDDAHRGLIAAADAIATRWTEPDAGIWELDPRHWTHSRLTCVAGLRAAAQVPGGDTPGWNALADRIMATATADGVHGTGRWQRAADDQRIDAALLVPALRGAVLPTDPRTVATLNAVRSELEQDGYVYRFRHDDRPLAAAEGAFVLCGFWTAMTLQQQGDPVAAARFFERSRAACGPPGIFSEEYDVEQRQMRGNLPQAFVHALLIESSLRLGLPPTSGVHDRTTTTTTTTQQSLPREKENDS
ncbi:glycoside hydrolase [Mycolicibacterium madagascariense]|uniref:Glycoside hydrolase n=1 Tax=Mycolicibacterium madagascariense TaxID=212765 RepID=A0A7I7XHC6_9MYCO|nr:glycoside hydrolase family 15 protein [Mycolicibacterium madagascariense]MCV7014356.1 glycoside hydrolase family 15 protein [Mycolicibacterium madagascariense]BBZ28553.1 glycoside hydrolase [Mycolicibacterium madagascariense]